jgi:hypothetical protein
LAIIARLTQPEPISALLPAQLGRRATGVHLWSNFNAPLYPSLFRSLLAAAL